MRKRYLYVATLLIVLGGTSVAACASLARTSVPPDQAKLDQEFPIGMTKDSALLKLRRMGLGYDLLDSTRKNLETAGPVVHGLIRNVGRDAYGPLSLDFYFTFGPDGRLVKRDYRLGT